MGNSSRKCVFCEIISGIDNKETSDDDKVLASNDKLAILSDLHPAAKHHYLVIPRRHVKNPKLLKGENDMQLVKDMYEYGRNYLNSVETEDTMKDALFGFHFPPFISVDHLHLHVICPASTMNFTNSNLFRINTWYFISPENMIERLQQQL